jgi:glutathione S-transferase
MDETLAGKEYLLGEFSIADAALFYVEFWATRVGLDLPGECAAHFARMKARPAVRRMLEQEGLPV